MAIPRANECNSQLAWYSEFYFCCLQWQRSQDPSHVPWTLLWHWSSPCMQTNQEQRWFRPCIFCLKDGDKKCFPHAHLMVSIREPGWTHLSFRKYFCSEQGPRALEGKGDVSRDNVWAGLWKHLLAGGSITRLCGTKVAGNNPSLSAAAANREELG